MDPISILLAIGVVCILFAGQSLKKQTAKLAAKNQRSRARDAGLAASPLD